MRLEKIFIKQKTKKNLSTTKTKDIEKIFLNQKRIFLNLESIMIMMMLNTDE